MRKKTVTEEPTAYAEIGTYLHRSEGKAKVKSYVSCNEPLKVDSAVDTKQIQKLRVEVHVKEDTGVKDNQFYEKDVETIQITNGGDIQPTTENSSEPLYNEIPSPDGLSPLKVLKNFVDKIKEEQTMMWVVVGVSLVLGALGLGLALR